MALSGGDTGMDVIHRICQDAAGYLRPGGWLFMEIGADIGEAVEQAFLQAGRYDRIKIVQDWAGQPRVVQARRRGGEGEA